MISLGSGLSSSPADLAVISLAWLAGPADFQQQQVDAQSLELHKPPVASLGRPEVVATVAGEECLNNLGEHNECVRLLEAPSLRRVF